MGFDAVFLQTRIYTEFKARIAVDFVHRDTKGLALGRYDFPYVTVFYEPIRCVHPVQWLVSAPIGMDRHTAVGLDHNQAVRRWKVGGKTSVVVDGAVC